MKTKLIKTTDYLLLINEKAEIKEGDYYLDGDNNLFTPQHNFFAIKIFNKVIAYSPLNSEAKELDLPWLPNPFGKEIDETTLFKNLGHECFIKMKELNPSGGIKEFIRIAVEFGYKTAQSSNKQYSLEDVKKAFSYYAFTSISNQPYNDVELEQEFNQFIQSLSTQKLPKEFIPEYEYQTREGEWKEVLLPSEWFGIDEGDNPKRLKTVTNSEGKQELVGTYKY